MTIKKTRSIFCLSFCLIMLVGLATSASAIQAAYDHSSGSGSVTSPDISGSFSDPNFKQAVWEWLGHDKSETPVSFTKQDLVTRTAQDDLLDVNNREITSLAGLENFEGTELRVLYIQSNNLTSLPALPSSLTALDCTNNQLTSLPTLSSKMINLICSKNQLTSLPELPKYLTHLNCDNNKLTSLPALPSSLWSLFCDNNQLTNLPELPHLTHFGYSGNPLTSLPTIPGR